jgi:hypothetical protein
MKDVRKSVRRLALALPEATEQDHHGMVSFRVDKKIFATVPDAEHVRIMVSEPEILAAVAENPLVCEPCTGASGWPAWPSTYGGRRRSWCRSC